MDAKTSDFARIYIYSYCCSIQVNLKKMYNIYENDNSRLE